MVIKTTVTSTGGLERALEGIIDRAKEMEENPPRVQIACPHCGNTSFEHDVEKGEDGHLTCTKCRTDLGTQQDVMDQAVAEIARKLFEG